MAFLARARHHEDELLDDPSTPREEAERSLRDLERFNTLAGGLRVYRRMLASLRPEPEAILDIGTGTSDMLSRTRAKLRVGLDLNIHHLAYGKGRSGNVPGRVAGDALNLPFRDDSFDVVTSSHFLHHFDEDESLALIEESLRVARHAIVFSDTRRSFAPWLFTKILGWVGLVGRVTKFDAPASVQRGFSPDELHQLGKRTGLRYEVTRYLPFRVVLTVFRS